jgi:hypothetical protein
MIPFDIIFDEPSWPDLKDKAAVAQGDIVGVAVLNHGMQSGKPSVAFRIETKYGQTIIAQTSARLFCTGAKAIMARYPDLFEGD